MPLSQPKFLVTGASGFLGQALALKLARSLGRTRVLLRQPTQAAAFANENVEVCIGSLTDTASLQVAVDGVEIVFHCAAASTEWAPWALYFESNVIGTRNLLEAAARSTTLQRFVHISSTDVYGYPKTVCDESAPLRDVGLPYNKSKVLGEQEAWRMAETKGLPLTVIRPATIYGPRAEIFLVSFAEFVKARDMLLINGGKSAVGLLYIDNAVDAIIAAAASPNTLGQAYNLRDETTESWRQYFAAMAKALGVPEPWYRLPFFAAYAMAATLEKIQTWLRLPGKPLITRHAVYLMSRDAAFPIAKAQRDFGFRSTISFEEGMARSMAWLNARNAGH